MVRVAQPQDALLDGVQDIGVGVGAGDHRRGVGHAALLRPAGADAGPSSHSSSGKPGCQCRPAGTRAAQGPLVTVVTPIVTSDLSAQPGRLSGANSALNWPGG